MRGVIILCVGLLTALMSAHSALHDAKLRACAAEARLINAESRALTANQRLAAYTLEDWRHDDDRDVINR